MKYESDTLLGGRYRDEDTNFEGIAKAITFYRNGCERVALVALVNHVPVEHWFDSPTLTRVWPNGKAMGFKSDLSSVGDNVY